MLVFKHATLFLFYLLRSFTIFLACSQQKGHPKWRRRPSTVAPFTRSVACTVCPLVLSSVVCLLLQLQHVLSSSQSTARGPWQACFAKRPH